MTEIYSDLMEINRLQESIFRYIDCWAKTQKTPIPKKQIMKKMKDDGIKDSTTLFAIGSLLRKGYIRKACSISNRTRYVICRTI